MVSKASRCCCCCFGRSAYRIYPVSDYGSPFGFILGQASAQLYRERFPHDVALHQLAWLLRTNHLSLLQGQEWHNSVWEPGLLRQEKPFGSGLSFHLMVFLTKFQDFGPCDTLLSHGNFAHQRVFGRPPSSTDYRMTPRIPA